MRQDEFLLALLIPLTVIAYLVWSNTLTKAFGEFAGGGIDFSS